MLFSMIFINYLFNKIYSYLFNFFILIQIFSNNLFSQSQDISFINISDNSRINALGGHNISLNNNYFFENPAFIKSKSLSLNYLNFISDINSSSFLYSDTSKYIGNYGFGIKYFSSGEFKGYDNFGNFTGNFYPNEYSIFFGKSFSWSNFSIGTNLKYVYSKYFDYSVSGFLIDFGTIITPIKDKDVSLAVVLKNFGFIFGENQLDLPSYFKIGSSVKPQYMPFRFSLTYIGSQKNYLKENFSFGLEVLLSKYLDILLGYNYLNDKSFKLINSSKLNGVSYGLELKLKRIILNYSRLILNSISNSNNISINYNLKKL